MNILKKFGLLLIGVLFMACSGSPAPATVEAPAGGKLTDELDAAVRETSDYLNAHLAKGNKLVILNIQSAYPALSEYIIDELIANTVNDRVFTAVDRQRLDAIRAELDFQYSGEVDDDTMQTLGRMAGAQIIISGAVSKIGDLYRLRVSALSVQNAQIQGQFNRNIPDGPTVSALARSQATGYGDSGTAPGRPADQGAQAVQARQAAAQGAATAPAAKVSPAAPAKVYKVGDTGPAGGIVFFDNGDANGKWRYLEAAPALFEFTSDWSSAIEGCKSLIVGGFTGWRLPTNVELNIMYLNLFKQGLGGFNKSGYYWSSSESGINNAWLQYFENGDQANLPTWRDFKVRAVRQF
jgi:hypothetical protein